MSSQAAKQSLAVPVGASDHIAGSPHAPVIIVQYGDFECPQCVAAEPALRQFRDRHPADVAFVFRHFPIEESHPHALLAAEAAESAGAQGAFWSMHDLLLQPGRHLARAHLEALAGRLNLDTARFKAELDDEIYRQRVREHQEGGRRSHVRGTPAFFVNGHFCDVSGGMHALAESAAAAAHRASVR